MIDFSYQNIAASAILNSLSGDYLASILAACPGSGKTTISHIILNEYFKQNPNNRVVVLTHGQNTLRLQYLQELDSPNVPVLFQYGGFEDGKQVSVGIPQSIQKYNGKIDLLIVDEAHQFYLANSVQAIVKKYKPKNTILMTGSPTKYNLYNQTNWDSQFFIHYIPAEVLVDKGVFSDVDLTVARTNKRSPKQAIKDALIQAQIEDMDVSKLMVSCSTIDYAKAVGAYLESLGRVVAISTSEGEGDEEIDRFKAGEADVLVVVNKGILGFNDKEITCLIDLKSTMNIDTSYQLFARVLRTHPNNIRKGYIRVAGEDYNDQVLMLHKMLALMKPEVFCGFNGKNLELTIDMMI